MPTPVVTFIVPCYKLAHFLPECLTSILNQTYTDFEILVMDDCSPDNTGDVVRSFNDTRIRYIRNEPNLGHLRNYNKGLELSNGQYIWLISADDLLRAPDALERYVKVLEQNPRIGYICSAGMDLTEDGEMGVLKTYCQADCDTIFNGQSFIPKILSSSGILAASVMARKAC
jgi:glycosyltransferase involved in cell wall biosynthesis